MTTTNTAGAIRAAEKIISVESQRKWSLSETEIFEIIDRETGMKKLLIALKDLLEQVESLEDFTLTRDAEPYKAEACWDYAIHQAHEAIKKE